MEFQEFIELFRRIMNQIQQVRTKNISFGGTSALQTASIHLIEISRHENANMTVLADKLGITKGTVAQMAKKLEEKSPISRSHHGTNNKEQYFSLTKEGWKVFNGHEQLHQKMYQEAEAFLDGFTPDDLEKAEMILEGIETRMKEYQHGI